MRCQMWSARRALKRQNGEPRDWIGGKSAGLLDGDQTGEPLRIRVAAQHTGEDGALGHDGHDISSARGSQELHHLHADALG